MVGRLLCLLFIFPLVATAGEGFRVFAPSRESKALLVVDAEATSGGELTLSLSRRVDLGYPPTTITARPGNEVLYVSTNNADTPGDAPGSLIRLDPKGGLAKAEPIVLEHGYAYLSTDRRGRFLLGANYRGGQVDVYPIGDKGSLGDAVTKLDEGRKNAHCILPSPDNRFVYIPYVKDTNGLYQYALDGETGSLTPLDPKNAKPPEGTGPRHLAYHPTKPFLYFSNEQHVGVSVYERHLESGQLAVVQVCDAVDDARSKDGISSSDIVITPDGKFVFAGIRGHRQDFDRISRYRVRDDGRLELLGLTPADKIPWGLALSPDGRYLLVSAFGAGTLTAFEVRGDGELVKAASLDWDPKISDLIAVPARFD